MFLDFDFIFLNISLLAIFTIAGINVSKGYPYWKNAGICILMFTFVLGCRYMRGNDYAHYMDVYEYNLESGQKVFTWLCLFMKYLGINAYMSFVVYATIFSSSLFVFLYRYRKYAYLIFPLSVIALTFFHEYMIRQELSYAFVFLYLNSLFCIDFNRLIKQKYLDTDTVKNLCLCLVFALITASIHSANIPVIALFTFVYIFIKKPISWKYSIPILVVSTYILSKVVDLSAYNSLFNLLGSVDDKFASYADNSSSWFGADGKEDTYTRKWYILIFEMLGHSSAFYLGYKILKEHLDIRSVTTIFNCYVFGSIFMNLFRELELLNRMGYVFAIWWFIPVAFILAFYRKVNYAWIEKLLHVFLIFYLYDYLKYLLMTPEMTSFLWDIQHVYE